MATLSIVKAKMATEVLTPEAVKLWQSPPFQRPLRENQKVQALAEEMKQTETIPGVITLGDLNAKRYLIDGQHRIHAFLLSEVPEVLADVRIMEFEDRGAMAREFVNLNGKLATMKPDDVLRGLEDDTPTMKLIRKKCPFIGYDQIRRGPSNPIVSMSLVLRSWFSSKPDVPASNKRGAVELVSELTEDESDRLIDFFAIAYAAWGADQEYARLWSSLNLTIVAWLYHRTVIGRYSPKTPQVTRELWAKVLPALSASDAYLTWLVGRQLSDRDRAPCYDRIKQIITRRLSEEMRQKVYLPQPPWAHGRVRSGGA